MLPTIPVLSFEQKPIAKTVSISEELSAARAIAVFELAPWLKVHPKADLTLTFADPLVTPIQTNFLRTKLGYKNTLPVLDSQVLTLVFDLPTRTAAKRLSMEAYVFLGSFPKGFRARYVIRTDGKVPRVVSRTLMEWYEVEPIKPGKTNT